jgi:hypothetical protein
MRRAPIIVLSALALLLTAGGAAAEDEATPSPEQSRRRSVEILAHIDQPEAEESWLSHHLARIHLHGKTGLEYTRPLSLAERDLELSLRGPALGRKSLGLSFEIRF